MKSGKQENGIFLKIRTKQNHKTRISIQLFGVQHFNYKNRMAAQTQTMTAEPKAKETEQFLTGAQAIMQSLVEQGVDTIFGYPGGAIMPTYDALYDYQDRLKHILVRHEQGAGHAAQGYARMTNRAGVAMVTSGREQLTS
jgi:basic membrane lipoprotein Med (substrate-binding protein (PBP1-ABC) superfamily)